MWGCSEGGRGCCAALTDLCVRAPWWCHLHAQAWMTELDQDGDGRISFEEFSDGATASLIAQSEDTLHKGKCLRVLLLSA